MISPTAWICTETTKVLIRTVSLKKNPLSYLIIYIKTWKFQGLFCFVFMEAIWITQRPEVRVFTVLLFEVNGAIEFSLPHTGISGSKIKEQTKELKTAWAEKHLN